ncbi:MAG TPA: YceI family protein [Ignavibacteriaceae bacterium]|nr:YceI family protein [Ignavibacteriaceae bacterium]
MKKLKLFILIILFSVAAFAQEVKWKVDNAHSSVKFVVTHMLVSQVEGKFTKYEGDVTSVGDDFTKGKISFVIDVNSISTDNEKRDNHLKSDDFFNAEKYPKITFVGKSLEKTGDKKYKLTGDLTIRDKTKSVVLDVTQGGILKDKGGNSVRTGFMIEGTVNRFDYDLKWNALTEMGGAVVSKEVDMKISLELTPEKNS